MGSMLLLTACSGLVLALVMLAASFDAAELRSYLPMLADGLATTLFTTAFTFCAGSLLALPLAVADISGVPGLTHGTRFYFFCFRYSPLLAQLYLVYFGAGEISSELQRLGLWWLFREPLTCVLVVFTLNTAAYQGFYIAGAIRALPPEQKEAAYALGMGPIAAFWKVLLPQALLLALRPLGNEFTKMIKASSLASVVTILDLFGTTNLIYNDTFRFEYFALAGLIYIGLVECSRLGVEAISRALTRHKGIG